MTAPDLAPRVRRHAGWLLLVAWSALGWSGGQDVTPSGRMLLAALQGHRYERRTYGTQGRLDERAIIEVGQLEVGTGEVSVPLQVAVYKDDAIDRTFSTRWTCAPRASDMLMSILVFGDDLDKPAMRLETTGTPVELPSSLPLSGTLPDVSIELRVRQGLLGFFGARTRITLTERRVRQSPSPTIGRPGSTLTVSSHVDLRAYAWGIRVRHTQYESEEIVDRDGGLLEETLKREDGSYSVLRRIG